MQNQDDNDLTQLLSKITQGDPDAGAEMTPKILSELHKLASVHMRAEQSGHTLQTTALVNEAYLKMVGSKVNLTNRAHFFALAAKQMRRILVDHARKKTAEKRGGKAPHIQLDEGLSFNQESLSNVIFVDQLFCQLEQFDQRASRMLEMRLFSGLSNSELAEVEGVSLTTVERDIKAAKAWMQSKFKN